MNIPRRDIKHYALVGALLLVVVLVEIFKEKPVDWTFYVSRDSKDPYGTYLLYECMPDLFPNITENEKTLNTLLNMQMYKNTNLLIITNDFVIPETEYKALTNYVARGNNAFISAFQFRGMFADSLNIATVPDWLYNIDSIDYHFTNIRLKDSVEWFGERFEYYYFTSYDTAQAQILSYESEGHVDFYRMPFGQGYFYLHSRPDVFTNYALLTQEKAGYAFSILSHLPEDDIFWDEYYKPYKEDQSSPLRYVFLQEALTYAWYVLAVVLILFMLFASKRTQRIIPLKEPLKNTTMQFVETLGSLYYSRKNHRQIAQNRMLYFADEISRNFYIPHAEITAENITYLAEKTGSAESFWNRFFTLKAHADNADNSVNAGFLTELDLHLETFYINRK